MRQPLPTGEWELQLNFDGNPPEVTGGVLPPPTLNEFGTVPEGEQVYEHLWDMLLRDDCIYGEVGVRQVIWFRDGNRLWSDENLYPNVVLPE
ncbi:MAG: hypothetical protein AAF456_11075 [Planctomycetota bacterium]